MKISKSIFLGKEEKVKQVYNTDIIDKINFLTYLDKDKIYTKDDILNYPEKFADISFIFSTWGMPVFSYEEIKYHFPSLKAVFYAAGTVQSFARPFIENGIKVFSAWAANAVPVAEYTFAQIILAQKGFFKGSEAFKSTKSKQISSKICKKYGGNYETRVGLLGCGMIGSLVAKKLKSLNVEVIVFDPFLSDAAAKELSVKRTSLAEVFSASNVVSNHLANNEKTKGILNYDLFASMLPYATFINTGRGAQVVEEELIQAFRERSDLTALLDVTMPEPPLISSPLYELSNVILTPHIAGSMGNEVHRMAEYMYNEFRSLINEQPTSYSVSLKMLDTMA